MPRWAHGKGGLGGKSRLRQAGTCQVGVHSKGRLVALQRGWDAPLLDQRARQVVVCVRERRLQPQRRLRDQPRRTPQRSRNVRRGGSAVAVAALGGSPSRYQCYEPSAMPDQQTTRPINHGLPSRAVVHPAWMYTMVAQTAKGCTDVSV